MLICPAHLANVASMPYEIQTSFLFNLPYSRNI